MTRLTIIGLALVLATGCAAQTTQAGDDDGNPGPGPVTPEVGAWHYGEVTPLSSTCSTTLQQADQPGDFAIDQASVTTFHVIPDDATAPFACTLSNGAFNCPDRAAFSHDYHPDADAIVTAHATASGTFSTSTQATGRQDATVDCTGSACAAVGTLPCSLSVHFAISAS
jgi:hypothetical protein